MTSKDKDSKSIQEKLKDFFKSKKGTAVHRADLVLTPEILKDLSRDSPLNGRLKVMKELSEGVAKNKLEKNAVEKLWKTVEDLFHVRNAMETRHQAFLFLQNLVKGQLTGINMMRAQFFRFIKNHDVPEDLGDRLDLLIVLTSNGKDILYFEDEVGDFLLKWLPDVTKAGKIRDYLLMIDNVIKFNASYMDENVISGFIQHIWLLCCSPNSDKTMVCLQIMSSIVAYGNMSPEALPKFIGTLCRTANVPAYCNDSWKIMKTLLGTDKGHSALYTMCNILKERDLMSEVVLLRGAVFYVHSALWGPQKLQQLHCPPSSVLPAFLNAAKSSQPAVSLELLTGIRQLITRHSLEDPSWSIIFDILHEIIKQMDFYPNQPPINLMVPVLHDILNQIEDLYLKDNFKGSVKQFFQIVSECSNGRPEASMVNLIKYLSLSIVPTECGWLTNLHNLLQKYFKMDDRTRVRLKVLEVLDHVVSLNRLQYEDELIEFIIKPHLGNIASDGDVEVRISVANLLLEICMECELKKCTEVLEILEKLLRRPFDYHVVQDHETDWSDVKLLVSGLLNVFTKKIYKLPSSHAIQIYNMLVGFLEQHYQHNRVFDSNNKIRLMIFECFLKMRANGLHHLGYPNSDKIVKFSPYLCVKYEESWGASPPPQSPAITQQQHVPCQITHVSPHRIFKAFITCLNNEKDWEVLSFVLKEMPVVFQNKSLILTKHCNPDLKVLVSVLCNMISERSLNLPDSLNVKVNKVDFHSAVITVLVALASYHSYLDLEYRRQIISCLANCSKTGPKCSKPCIAALTICTLEMRDVMVKMLPDVLLILSKISATIYIAIPMLEFLSTLTQLPMVFANFVADQYMAVFAISLPYTNPFKYDHYIVSLAHHVIAVWFLKCRLPFRKDFVKFITKGLHSNVLLNKSSDLATMNNEDSSDRKRSSSFTEQSTRRKVPINPVPFRPKGDDKAANNFYKELTETCIDLMARYAFSPCSALPRRLPGADFLLNGGQSMCWLIGNKLVTVTTSGCSQKVLKQGLCDKCWSLCNSRQVRSSTTRQNSNENNTNNTSASSPLDENKKVGDKLDSLPGKLQQLIPPTGRDKQTCACWCQGWAEIYVRRPTGDMSWVMRIQNQISYQHSMYEFPLNEISTLYMPSLNLDFTPTTMGAGHKVLQRQATSCEEPAPNTMDTPTASPARQIPGSPTRQDSLEDDSDCIYDDGNGGKSRNPVRRSNSSPEMSANWKNPFMQKTGEEPDDDDPVKKNKLYSKDMRVSCEAIPEEMAGMSTTPPSGEGGAPPPTYYQTHPSLLTCRSYPGSSPPSDAPNKLKPNQTVPASPNLMINPAHPPDFSRTEKTLSLDLIQPLTGKPPQSPTQTSPRLPRHASPASGHDLQKSLSASAALTAAREMARERKTSGNLDKMVNYDPQKRDRVHTISVMTLAPRAKPRSDQIRQPTTRSKEASKSGINPSFVFLQLYHAAYFGNDNERPLLVSASEKAQRAVKVLDKIPPYETHKIGVLYVQEGQINDEVAILKNRFGSMRYVNFLQNLGTLVRLADVDEQVFFLGGLDQNGSDGEFAYIWQDDVIRVTFHVATMMPNKESDPNCNNKKLHIGNNYVSIVYNESGEEFNIKTISGQYNFALIIIQPLDHNTNRVTVKTKKMLEDTMSMSEPKIISDQNLAILTRQLALHANLASMVANSLLHSSTDPYASNWLERLRKIKNIRSKIKQDIKSEEGAYPSDDSTRMKHVEDFTEYT